MVGVFVKSSKTLSVQNEYFHGLTFRSEAVDGFAPDPDTL